MEWPDEDDDDFFKEFDVDLDFDTNENTAEAPAVSPVSRGMEMEGSTRLTLLI